MRLRPQAGKRRAISARNGLVERHLALVEPIARRIHRNLPPSFDLSDLVSVGALGLIEAAARFERSLPASRFPAFARQRIAGAILDSVRRRHYREATHQPLDVLTDTVAADCTEQLDHAQTVQRVREILNRLPRDQARVLDLRYWRGLPLTRVAARMKLSTSTAWRLHHRALASLKAELSGGR